MYDSLSRFADDEVNLSVCEYSFVESHCSTVENFHYCQTCESHPAKKKKIIYFLVYFCCLLLWWSDVPSPAFHVKANINMVNLTT